MRSAELGPRFRGDERGEFGALYQPFVPAEAGTQGQNYRLWPHRFSEAYGMNREVPSRSMRGSRSVSHDRYSFIALLVSPERS